VARSRNHCCHEIAAMRSLCTGDLHEVVNSIKPFNVTMETKTGFPNYKIIGTAVNNIHVSFRVKFLIFLSDFNQIWSCLQIFVRVADIIFMQILPMAAALLQADRQTDGRTDFMKPVDALRHLYLCERA